MKKLNNEGFTLVELLAVIIILAIVVGITIPAVLNTVDSSKNKALGVAAEAAQTWLENQALLYNTDYTAADATFISSWSAVATSTGTLSTMTVTSSAALMTLGLKSTNVATLTITAKGNGRACVEIKSVPAKSDYFVSKYWNTPASATANVTAKTGANNKSSHC